MNRMNMGTQLVVALCFVAAVLLHGTASDEITVGGSTGWSVPSSTNTTFYSLWASTKTFEVNDTLVFNFATNAHDVAKVAKDAYDGCNTTNTIDIIRTGPANVKLNATGQHYFICTFPGHCASGQKLSINVVADTDDDSRPSPGPSGTGSNTPNIASSHGYGVTLSVILMFITVALFC